MYLLRIKIRFFYGSRLKQFTKDFEHKFATELKIDAHQVCPTLDAGDLVKINFPFLKISYRKEYPDQVSQMTNEPIIRSSQLITQQQHDYQLYRKSQDQIINQENLDSVGVLAGGIAHDFNNLLVSILGNIDLLKTDEVSNIEKDEALKQAESASIQARDLARQMMTFFKGGEPIRSVIPNVDQAIQEIVTFSLHGRKSRANFAFSDDLWSIKADKNQFSQVIRNLVLNADEAITKEDSIDITVTNEEITPNFFDKYCRRPGT